MRKITPALDSDSGFGSKAGLDLASAVGLKGRFDAFLPALRGDILVERGEVEEAERSLVAALETSRTQGSRIFDLRAVTSLARLLGDQERRDDARALLQPVYAWFTEGFDTADLKDARALLDALG